jgi:hypothetical protein
MSTVSLMVAEECGSGDGGVDAGASAGASPKDTSVSPAAAWRDRALARSNSSASEEDVFISSVADSRGHGGQCANVCEEDCNCIIMADDAGEENMAE